MNGKCHEEKSLQENQFARKQTTAIESVMQKTMSIDLQRVSGQEAVLVDYDATSCYDRVLPSFAEFACRRLGLHPGDSSFLPKLLSSLRHHILIDGNRTEGFFPHQDPLPVYGTGQGAGWYPFLWTSVDDIILKTMKT